MNSNSGWMAALFFLVSKCNTARVGCRTSHSLRWSLLLSNKCQYFIRKIVSFFAFIVCVCFLLASHITYYDVNVSFVCTMWDRNEKNVTMIILEFALRVCLYYHSRYCQMARGLKGVFAQWVQDGQNIYLIRKKEFSSQFFPPFIAKSFVIPKIYLSSH